MLQRFHRLSIQRKGMIVAIILLAGSGVVLGGVRLGKRSPTVPTIEVKHEEFVDPPQFPGELKALNSIRNSAAAEAGDLQIVKVSSEGTVVKPDDVVVEFDKTKTEQELAQYQSSLKSAEAEIGQARAQARLAEEEDKTAVLKAGYDVESAKLEASKQEIVSKIEGEEANLKVADAEQKLREAQTKEKSDKTLNQATVESKEQASKKAEYDVQRANRALAQMTQRAPSAGTIRLFQHWSRSHQTAYR